MKHTISLWIALFRVAEVLIFMRTAAARKPTAAKPRFGAAKKPGAKPGGGLGVKKMTTKADDSLFDQAPAAEVPPPTAAAAAALAGLSSSLSVRLFPLLYTTWLE